MALSTLVSPVIENSVTDKCTNFVYKNSLQNHVWNSQLNVVHRTNEAQQHSIFILNGTKIHIIAKEFYVLVMQSIWEES